MDLEPYGQPISPRPLHSEVADRLRELIVHGELAPGDRLNERLLTERFGISRTPLREAIKMLASEGLVDLLPNRGAVVTALTRDTALDMFQVLASLESLAGRLVCERATDNDVAEIVALHAQMRERHECGDLEEYFRLNQIIHQRIVEAAGNAELRAMHRRISVRLRRFRRLGDYSQARWDAAMAEHEAIVTALTQRDGQQLGELLTAHLQNKLKVMIEWLETHEGDGRTSDSPRRAGNGSAASHDSPRPADVPAALVR